MVCVVFAVGFVVVVVVVVVCQDGFFVCGCVGGDAGNAYMQVRA